MVDLTTADISDSAGTQAILAGIRKRCPWVKHLFAAAADRLKLMDKAADLDFVVEVIRRADTTSVPTTRKVSRSSRGDGWWSAPSAG